MIEISSMRFEAIRVACWTLGAEITLYLRMGEGYE
jgi:hypothetical protein